MSEYQPDRPGTPAEGVPPGPAGASSQPPGQYYPGAPPVSGSEYGTAPVPAGPPPREVTLASTLLIVSAVLGVLGAIVALANKSAFTDAIRKSNPSYSTDKVNSTYNAAVAITIVIALVLAALYILLARQVRKGRPWARIVAIVLAVLGVLSGLSALAGDSPALSKVISVIGMLLAVAIIVLLSLRPAGEYFKANSTPRR